VGRLFPLKIASSYASEPLSDTWFLGPTRVLNQTTSRSAQPFFCRAHDRDRPTDRPTDHTTSVTIKGKEEYLYSAILVRTHTLKTLRHGSHSFTCKQHHACLFFVSVHQMAPPQLMQQISNCSFTTHLSTRRDERLSWPGWLTYSGWLIHISDHPSATGRA